MCSQHFNASSYFLCPSFSLTYRNAKGSGGHWKHSNSSTGISTTNFMAIPRSLWRYVALDQSVNRQTRQKQVVRMLKLCLKMVVTTQPFFWDESKMMTLIYFFTTQIKVTSELLFKCIAIRNESIKTLGCCKFRMRTTLETSWSRLHFKVGFMGTNYLFKPKTKWVAQHKPLNGVDKTVSHLVCNALIFFFYNSDTHLTSFFFLQFTETEF